MIKDMVSVIIPVYNGAPWIKECIESVLNQTYKQLEVLVLDDASKDGTPQIVESLAKEDNRVRLICRKDRGVSGARNQGIDEAQGEFITFVDSDDMLEAGMLETLHIYLEKEKSDIALCGFYKWDGKNQEELLARENQEAGQKKPNVQDAKKVPKDNNDEKRTLVTVGRETYLKEYLLHSYTRCWSILYRRDAIKDVRFRKDLTIGEDMMFLMDLLPHLERITITEYKGYFYRVNEQGVMLRPFTRFYMDELKSWKMAKKMIEEKYPEQVKRVAGILAVSSMLAAGKLARLSGEEQKKYADCIKECHTTVKEALAVSGAKEELPSGYGIKTKLFVYSPRLYLKLYHLWKCKNI